MDRQEIRNYDTAVAYTEWSKDRIEELELSISNLTDNVSELEDENKSLREQVKDLQRSVSQAEAALENMSQRGE